MMDGSSRFFWVSMTSAGEHEQKLFESLAAMHPLQLQLDEFLDIPDVREEDVIVLNRPQSKEQTEALVTQILEAEPNVRLIVRSEIDSFRLDLPQKTTRQIPILDANEGPELTRSRLISAIAGERRQGERIPEWRKQLIGESHAAQKVAEVIRLVGPRRCTVLITGETGTGKEVVARAIHKAGPRAAGPFVALNCSAVPAALLEAELFGHTRGAFTGATQIRAGRFEQADGGTLFLDEIGDLPHELQAKLLRVLQEREFQKLGSSETIRVDARVVAATNCDLQARVADGSFREDLFYRLNVVPVRLAPLRARISDVRPLAEHFLAKICREEQIALKRLTPQAWEALEQYDWPGNVRQLENSISSAVILSESRPYLDIEDFQLPKAQRMLPEVSLPGSMALPDHGIDFTRTVNAFERSLLSQALQRTRGNKKAAAQMLRLKRTTLSAKVRVLELMEDVA